MGWFDRFLQRLFGTTKENPMPVLTDIQLRKGTVAQWTAANPIMKAGEPGVETDTGRIKVGDGVKTWSGLVYSDALSLAAAAAAAEMAATSVQQSAVGAPNGIAELDAGSQVPVAQLPAGQADGLATLDEGGKIPMGQIPPGVGGDAVYVRYYSQSISTLSPGVLNNNIPINIFTSPVINSDGLKSYRITCRLWGAGAFDAGDQVTIWLPIQRGLWNAVTGVYDYVDIGGASGGSDILMVSLDTPPAGQVVYRVQFFSQPAYQSGTDPTHYSHISNDDHNFFSVEEVGAGGPVDYLGSKMEPIYLPFTADHLADGRILVSSPPLPATKKYKITASLPYLSCYPGAVPGDQFQFLLKIAPSLDPEAFDYLRGASFGVVGPVQPSYDRPGNIAMPTINAIVEAPAGFIFTLAVGPTLFVPEPNRAFVMLQTSFGYLLIEDL